jgi:hypothetical protein
VSTRRLLTLVCVIAAGPIVSACGSHTVHNARGISGAGAVGAADANNNGNYVRAGTMTYQLQVSRELNQYSPEDSEYIKGLPKGETKLAGNQLWYGVFMWAKNETNHTLSTTDNFDIVDTQGNKYYPVKLNVGANPFAWSAQPLAPGAVEPNPTSLAGYGPTGGRLVLFKLGNSIYDNRPLTLQIRAPSTNKLLGTISLDL